MCLGLLHDVVRTSYLYSYSIRLHQYFCTCVCGEGREGRYIFNADTVTGHNSLQARGNGLGT